MSRTKDAAELAAVLSAERTAHTIATTGDAACREAVRGLAPHQIAADALALLRIGASVKRWAERACNGIERYQGNGIWCGTWTEADDAAKGKADARALAKASEIAARYGASVTIGGDPRGYVLRLVLASGRSNTVGNDGWGVA